MIQARAAALIIERFVIDDSWNAIHHASPLLRFVVRIRVTRPQETMIPSDRISAYSPMMHHGEGRASTRFAGHFRLTYTGTYTALSPQN